MRYERKYRINFLSPAIARQVIRNHPASFRPLFPDRWVNNIYFDTPQFSAYHENMAGIPRRVKFRVRWYGPDPLQVEKPNIEIKSRYNELGDKRTIPFNKFNINQLETLTHEVNRLGNQFLQPVLLNSYLRSYYSTSNGKFRITIDRNLRYFPIFLSTNFVKYHMEEQAVIIELKYKASLDDLAQDIMQYLPFRQSKNSKYVMGLKLCLDTA